MLETQYVLKKLMYFRCDNVRRVRCHPISEGEANICQLISRGLIFASSDLAQKHILSNVGDRPATFVQAHPPLYRRLF
jgi:hypothetical protein